MSRKVSSSVKISRRNLVSRQFIDALESRVFLTAVKPNVIDIYIGYSAAALQAVGSQQLMVDKINRGVAFLNQALYNSKVDVSVRLVGTMQTTYAESGSGATDLSHLVNTTDGQLDDLTTAAAAAGADVTDVVVNNLDVGGITQGNFNVINLQYLDNGVLSHEFGHTLGGNHQHSAGDGPHTPDYAFEWEHNFNGTIVGGAIGQSLPYFSNPNVFYRGVATGVAGDGPDAANNALVMNNTAASVSNASAQKTPDTTGPVAQLNTVSALNGSVGGTPAYLSRAGWVLTASSNTGDVNNAIDGNAGTRWSTNTPQANGQYFQVDLGSSQNFNTITMDAGSSTTDYPRGYAILVSSTGTDWATQNPIATANGVTAVTSANFATVNARYIRIVQTGSDPTWWWSIAELNVGTSAGTAQSVITFNVSYGDGSGVNVDSLGNGNIMVTGPNNFSSPATLVSVGDPATDYAYETATYSVTVPGAAGNLNNYSFAVQANSISDTVGNFAPAGTLTSATTPLLPQYGGYSPDLSYNEGDLSGKDVLLSGELGAKYQNAFSSPMMFQFSLSKASSLTLASNMPSYFVPSLYQDVNGNLQLESTERIQPTSPGTWSNLAAGNNYYIQVAVYAGGPNFGTVTLTGSFQTPGATGGTIVPPPALSILSGTVFNDVNQNFGQDAGEPGIAGVAMTLTGNNYLGQAVALTAMTDGNGKFTFTGVPVSDATGYTITESVPASDTATSAQATFGSPGTFGTNSITKMVVTAGTTGTYLFANLVPAPPTTLSGTVFLDLNNNGVQDAGDSGIAGVQILLQHQSGGAFTNTFATTDANGNYTFTNVAQDNLNGYFITEIQPANVLQGTNTVGSLGGTLDTTVPDRFDNVPVNGIAGTGYNFAEQPLPTTNAPTPPTANNGQAAGMQNNTITGNVMTANTAAPMLRTHSLQTANVDSSSEYVEYIPGSGPLHAASFTLNTDGSFTYVPQHNFYGPDSFQYEVVDQDGLTAIAQVDITVTHVDQPPQAADEISSDMSTDSGVSVQADMVDYVSDPDSTSLTFKITGVTGGTAKLVNGNELTFVPAPNFVGDAVIHYTCSDGTLTTALSLKVAVNPVAKAPVTKTTYVNTLPSTAVSIDALKNDSDPDHMGIYFVSVANPAHGTAYIQYGSAEDGSLDRIMYRPNFGFHGTDHFSYTIANDEGQETTGWISATVIPGAGIGVDPTNSNLTALDIFGTPGNDKIVISNNGPAVSVTLNGKLLGVYNPTGIIAAFGGAGNDTIDASATNRSVWLFGEDGNDILTAGSGNDLLVGGRGSDKLYAGSGNDDIITGTADYDRSSGFVPLANLFKGNPFPINYLHGDSVPDAVNGGSGNDTFYATVTGNGVFDTINGRRVGELVVPI